MRKARALLAVRFRAGRRRVRPLVNDTTCPVCGRPAATQGNGTLLGHQRAVRGGGGFVPCEGSWTWPPGQ